MYVHLTLMSTLARQRADELAAHYGRQTSSSKIVPPEVAAARAYYLREQLVGALSGELGPAGHRLVTYYGTVLDVLCESPPPEGASVHLLLDRYRREARQVVYLLSDSHDPSQVARRLEPLGREEVARARDVIARVAPELVGRFDDRIGAILADRTPATEFGRIRGAISKTLLEASADGYTLSADRLADDLVDEMINTSGPVVMEILSR